MPPGLIGLVDFEYIDAPAWAVRLKRKERGLYFYYIVWQWLAYKRASVLVARSHFDYVVQLTFGSIWLPTFMHWLGVPFIWGPIGGGEAIPFRLIAMLPIGSRIAQYFRYVLIATVRFNPVVMRPIAEARHILARTEDTARLIPAAFISKVRVVPETGVSQENLKSWSRQPRIGSPSPIRVIYTGRLVGFKNVGAAIRAVARARALGHQIHFLIVGDGPERSSLAKLACMLNVADCVEFRGAVSHEEVLRALCESDIYLFPSLREAGVWSLIEAMAVGLPSICVNASGMALITDEQSAIRIAPTSQEGLVSGFADALMKLARSKELRQTLGDAAKRRIEQRFLWDDKVSVIKELLEQRPTGQ
jgi:glycosyltransferase involved in cell wall biosynthesis